MILEKNHCLVTIPDLSIGNLAAVANMVHRIGGEAIITSKPTDLKNAQRIILAGVGAFDTGMRALEEEGWLEPLKKIKNEGQVPILGICLGMQLMCRSSEEGKLPGIGWFNADVKKIIPSNSEIKVPHMGWNTVQVQKSNSLIPDNAEEQRFYFVHSYHAVCTEPQDVLASTFYGCELTAGISKQNIYGMQFHPEKSHRFGLSLIKNFLEI